MKIISRLIILLIFIPFMSCQDRGRRNITLAGSRQGTSEVKLYADPGIGGVDVYVEFFEGGGQVWGPIKIDTRDIVEDVYSAYSNIEWDEHHFYIGPGRSDGKIKVVRSTGNVVGRFKEN